LYFSRALRKANRTSRSPWAVVCHPSNLTMHTMESIARAVLVHAEGPKGVAVRPVDRRAGQDKEEGEWQFY
jgi:hypothetical protein